MSYEDGWAALNLEKPARIPRTEYSAPNHWELVRAVTGIQVGVDSSNVIKSQASDAFMRAWNFDFMWSTLIGNNEFGELTTDMGHAEYAAGGVDRRDTIYCPYKTPEEVLSLDLWEAVGPQDKEALKQRFTEHYARNVAAHDYAINMTGTYVTEISGLIALFGWDMLLLAAGIDIKAFGAMANRYASYMQQYFDALAETDVPCVMVHDDMVWSSGPFLRPAWYREYVFPNFKKYFSPLLDSGKKIIFTSDGDYTMFIDDLVDTGVHGFVLEPLTDMSYMVEKYGQSHVIIGNADVRILMHNNKAEIRAEVERCMDLGRDCPGFFMAVGNHIPPNTPVEACLYYNEVYEELSHR